MKMFPSIRGVQACGVFGLAMFVMVLSGCPTAEEKTPPVKPETETPAATQSAVKPTEKPPVPATSKPESKPSEAQKPASEAAGKKVTAQKPAAQSAAVQAVPEKPSQDKAKPAAAAPPQNTTSAQTKPMRADVAEQIAQDVEEARTRPRDLGQPLVEHPEALVRLDPKQPVWVDRKNKHVVLLGEVCTAGYPLEFFATYANRSYEAVLSVNVVPSIVHAGLLAVGAKPGHPVQFQPTFVPPAGTEVAIEVRWKDATGKVQSAPAQHWIRNIQTKKELDSNWVFAGSMVTTDERTGRKLYLADSGELICVLNLPTAMLDLPIRSYAALESRLFEAFAEHLPPEGTPTTVLLKPILTPVKAGDAAQVKDAAKTPAQPAAKQPPKIQLNDGPALGQ